MNDPSVTTGHDWKRAWLSAPAPARDAIFFSVVAAVTRIAIVIWGAPRFPPAEDGRYYHVVASRIADGMGYTWLWPDGAVTYAAHYPVGYPAVIGALYAVFGKRAVVAMVFNAAIGTAGVWAVHRLTATVAKRGGAALAALLAALHPALVFYTPALMTEGVVASLLVLAAYVVHRARRAPAAQRWLWTLGLGVLFGVITLVRPQTLLVAPFFGALALSAFGRRQAFAGAAMTLALTIAVCMPWTLRNCARMGRCVFVSANGGWNLLIGAADNANGAWVPIEQAGLSAECRTVFGEADKDACFGRDAVDKIVKEPGRWLGLIPAKLAVTFDYGGAPGWYLHSSNASAFGETHKVVLGVIETLWQRIVLLLAIVALVRQKSRPYGLVALAFLAAAFAVQRAAWVSYLVLIALAALSARGRPAHVPAALSAAVVAMTALTHALFFGAGRYSLVCYPLLAALAGASLTPSAPASDTGLSR